MKPINSGRLKKRELMIMTVLSCSCCRTLSANSPCGRTIRMPTIVSSVMTLAIEPDRKNSSVDWVCEIEKAEAMVPSERGGAAEHDHKEGVDDIELAGGGTGRADHGEGAARDAGDAAAETEGVAVDAFGVDADGARHHAVLHHGADSVGPNPTSTARRRPRW